MPEPLGTDSYCIVQVVLEGAIAIAQQDAHRSSKPAAGRVDAVIRYDYVGAAVSVEIPHRNSQRSRSHGIAHGRLESHRGFRGMTESACKEQGPDETCNTPFFCVHGELPLQGVPIDGLVFSTDPVGKVDTYERTGIGVDRGVC